VQDVSIIELASLTSREDEFSGARITLKK